MKRTPLEICALSIMTTALAVTILSFSHIFGIDVLSRIIPGMPEPLPLYFSPRSLLIYDVILPVFILFGILYVIWKSSTYVLARKLDHGFRPEFGLISVSFVMTGHALLFLSDHIQPSGRINDLLFLISIVLLLMTMVTLVIAFCYKYFVDPQFTAHDPEEHDSS